MKFGLIFANAGPFGRAEGLTHLAQTAESVGLESLWTVEHVVVPTGYASQYPYSQDGRMPGSEESPIPDPYVWLAYAAAVTKTIKLATGIIILPQRHPFYVAKEAATLDQLSGGRHILGVGIGWLEEEFKAMKVPFDKRASITDESIRALHDLWSEGPSSHKGDYYEWTAVESNPKPVGGRIPIVIGGHTKGAARRAARLGDGFFPGQADKLEECIAEIKAECARIGRDSSEVEISGGSRPTPDEVKRLEDLGVSRFVIGPPGFTKDDVESGLEKLGDELFSKF
ncbi:MAG: LLM class F420-dependent oxidoreductase [bacterium]|nr:LLM class F420-dependent oxidoreductase [Deltaproteobacteria bacterium]MCP4908279.1 LLM class F420-dependent oxidoreductase [bacterium]